MRAFIALPLPSSDAAVIEAAQDRLPVGRCTDPETLHLTLAFLGEQPIPVLEDLHEILSALHAPAFDLTLSGFISLGGDGGQALDLILGRNDRRGRQAAQIGALDPGGLQRDDVGANGVEAAGFQRQIKQRLCVAIADFRRSEIISH